MQWWRVEYKNCSFFTIFVDHFNKAELIPPHLFRLFYFHTYKPFNKFLYLDLYHLREKEIDLKADLSSVRSIDVTATYKDTTNVGFLAWWDE